MTTHDHASITVASFNLRNGLALDGWNAWPFRRQATLATIQALGADLYGLQEVYGFQARFIDRRLDGWDRSGDGRSARRGGERCPVLYRRARFELIATETRWFGPQMLCPGTKLPKASFPRVATIVDLRDRGSGAELRFIDTHLDERSKGNRLFAAGQLAEWMGDGPAIVVGDLNAVPESRVLARLEAAGLRSVLPADAGGTSHGFTGRTDGRRIDHILVSDHWAVSDGRVITGRPGGRLPSDHWPIVAEVRPAGVLAATTA